MVFSMISGTDIKNVKGCRKPVEVFNANYGNVL